MFLVIVELCLSHDRWFAAIRRKFAEKSPGPKLTPNISGIYATTGIGLSHDISAKKNYLPKRSFPDGWTKLRMINPFSKATLKVLTIFTTVSLVLSNYSDLDEAE